MKKNRSNRKRSKKAVSTNSPQQTPDPRLAQIYHQAHSLQQSGHLNNAEILYKKILKQVPNQPDSLHYLGLLYLQKGDLKNSAKYIKQSLKVTNNPVFYCNYGMLLNKQEKNAEAIKVYKKALDIKPDYAIGWFNLGVTHKELGEFYSAELAYLKAISCDNKYIKALHNLFAVQRIQGKEKEAMDTIQILQQVSPDTIDALLNLGTALYSSGGNTNIKKAREYFKKAQELNPDSLEVYRALAGCAEEGNDIEYALHAYENMLKIEPNYHDVKIKYANCLIKNHQLTLAEKKLEEILKYDNNNIFAMNGLADIYSKNGDFTKALEIYNKVISIDDYNDCAYAGITDNKKLTEADRNIIIKLNEICKRKRNSMSYFSLGKAYNDLAEYDNAFEAYKKANNIKNKYIDYNLYDHSEFVDQIINIFNKDLIDKLKPHGNPSNVPLFIVGTPRSGSTLTEQILASHSKVHGAGELEYIKELATDKYHILNKEEKYPGNILNISVDTITNEARIYLQKLREHNTDDSIIKITDKMPGNIFYLGYIAILFPNATIIHCKRNPIDSCLSMYFQNFNSGHKYSFNMENLVSWFKDYARLMSHWDFVLDNILHVYYENTVADLKNTAKRIIDYCDLEWEENCISFHEKEREVITASKWQVRQPIYKSSLKRWKRYEKHIPELIDALADIH